MDTRWDDTPEKLDDHLKYFGIRSGVGYTDLFMSAKDDQTNNYEFTHDNDHSQIPSDDYFPILTIFLHAGSNPHFADQSPIRPTQDGV